MIKIFTCDDHPNHEIFDCHLVTRVTRLGIMEDKMAKTN